jgi:hypothetical protein
MLYRNVARAPDVRCKASFPRPPARAKPRGMDGASHDGRSLCRLAAGARDRGGVRFSGLQRCGLFILRFLALSFG